jgi:heterodisulfide reductase subunit B2
MTELLYYPGCSMTGSARGYAASLDAIAGTLALDLRELDDWSCCGASEYFSLGPLRGYALVARNLALAEREANGSRTLVAPCSLCFVNLVKTERYVQQDAKLAGQVNDALEAGNLSYTPGAVTVRHLFEVIVHDIGLDAVGAAVTRPLSGLRVAPYLGCLVSRPDPDGRFSAKEQPRDLDRLIEALGAEAVDFPLRTDCCGGHLSQISPGMGLELIRRLLDGAAGLEADMLVTTCPMCQMNIDLYQGEVNHRFHTEYRIPILFFTQLMGLAFGHEAKALGIGAEVVSAREALARIGVEVPDAGEPPAGEEAVPARAKRPARHKGPELPMPRMPGNGEAPR